MLVLVMREEGRGEVEAEYIYRRRLQQALEEGTITSSKQTFTCCPAISRRDLDKTETTIYDWIFDDPWLAKRSKYP